MKTINMYIRVANLRKEDRTVDKYIGGLILEYNGTNKYFYYDEINEVDQHRCMWSLVVEGISKLKEPCHIIVHTLNQLGYVEDNEINGKNKSEEIRLKVKTMINNGGHSLHFDVCKDMEDERRIIFKKIKLDFEKDRRVYNKNMAT